MKLGTRIKRTKKIAKNLKIEINSLEIEAKEEDCTITKTKSIISHL